MHIIAQLLSSVSTTIALYGLYRLVKSRFFSPIRNLPGPQSSSWIWGNIKEIRDNEDAVLYQKWIKEYGRTFRYKSYFGGNRLLTLDNKALNHILMHNYIYQRSEPARYNLSLIVGTGVLVTEGDKHKLQRKVMNPAFGPAQIRDITSIFVDKSIELKDVWMSQITAEGGTARINVLEWLSKMTLDVIGRAGFHYEFNALTKHSAQSNELSNAFSAAMGNPDMDRIKNKPWNVLQSLFPVLRVFPGVRIPRFDKAKETMNRIGQNLLRESKASLQASGEKAGDLKSRDLLTLLLRSNMSGEPSQRMSDEDVLAQVPTFLAAGHETTATGTTWALYALVGRLDVQQKLRDELYTLQTENPTMEELNSLSYLDAVVRETLRLHAPVPSVMRVAAEDDVIPLSQPVIDRNGVTHNTLSVQKGQAISISILAINRDKAVWGEDALEFKPERWQNIPEAATSIPGVWGNMMTFLGGAKACIGYRFSLIEMKALLFVLIRGFEFELAVPREEIIKKSAIVQRPRVKSEPEKGSQLPLLVRAYQRD
ncbi:cytochrome P450 [Gymnopus androsaceus JB14]|uniref:Cytochrome P450 n=1 Tax=Gymnopus androsaceus JB14 TaxID=1447944 RepID=A0A6A4I3F6_9AGAR|nr:cytochrome P450 [Gymnopus androsaceus JB14]